MLRAFLKYSLFAILGAIATMGLLSLFGSTKASAGEFYQWTTSEGVIGYTNEAKRVPPAYRETAQVRSFAEISSKMFTPENTSSGIPADAWQLEKAPVSEAPTLVALPASEECDGHVTVEEVREQIDEYNVTLYITRDECGKAVAVTRSQPDVRINR